MIRKNYLTIVLLNIFVACAISIVWMLTTIQLDFLKPPFGLGDGYTAIRVSQFLPVDESDAQNLLSSIVDLVQDSDTLLVYENYQKLGLYDPAGVYAHETLVGGTYFDREDFKPEASAVLIKANSSLHQMLYDGFTIINAQLTPVRGIYERGHPLFTRQHNYITNYFASTDIPGTYYFPKGSDSMSQIVSLLEQSDYVLDYLPPPPDSLGSALLEMLSGSRYLSMVFGVAFLFFNSFLIYYVLLSRQGGVFSVHIRLGATRRSILAKLTTGVLLSVLTGASLGVLLFFGLFRIQYLYFMDLSMISGAMAVTITGSTLTFLLAFLGQNYWKDRAGLI